MNETDAPQEFEVGAFRVDAAQRVLLGADGARVPLSSRAFELLLYFVRHPGELLDKGRLMDAVWPDTVVEENNLNQCVGALRKALGEIPGDHRYLVTEPGRGYRLVAPVRAVTRAAGTPGLSSASRPPRRGIALGAAAALVIAIAAAWLGSRGREAPAQAAQTPSVAQETYRRARAFAERTTRSEADIRNSILAYEEVVRLEPRRAEAWAQISRRNANLYSLSYDRSRERRDAARHALGKAVEIAPDAVDTRLAQAYYLFRVVGDIAAAEKIYRGFLERDIRGADVHGGLAQVTRESGRWSEALAHYREALAADPQNPYRHAILCEDYLTGREIDLALRTCDRALDLLPGDAGTLALKASIYQALGDLPRGRELLAGVRPAPSDWRSLRMMTQQSMLEGDYAGAARLLETYLANEEALGVRLGPLRRRLADALRLENGMSAARPVYELARGELLRELARQPENGSLSAELAPVLARLGDAEGAAKQLRYCAVHAARPYRDTLDAECLAAKAEVAVIEGRLDDALGLLAAVIPRRGSLPPFTPAVLRRDPRWEPLREHPGFAAHVAESPPPATTRKQK